jgi:hypothetical protein
MGLEEALEQLHETGKPVEISWLWDGGVDVSARGEERNFPSVGDVVPWVRHWYGMPATVAHSDSLEAELQKIYDSDINITIRVDADSIAVGLGNDFTGFEVIENVRRVGDILPWLQAAIHAHHPASKYDVERLGGIFTPTWVEVPD